MKKKLLLVDLDGTLVDTRRPNFLAYQFALNQVGSDLTYEEYCTQCDGRNYRDFLPALVDSAYVNQVHDLKVAVYPQFLDSAVLNTALVTTLRQAKRSAHIALCTTASKACADAILDHFDLRSLFDLIVTKNDVKHTKPDPECYYYAMRHFNFDRAGVTVYEDSPVGLATAARAQLRCCEVTTFH